MAKMARRGLAAAALAALLCCLRQDTSFLSAGARRAVAEPRRVQGASAAGEGAGSNFHTSALSVLPLLGLAAISTKRRPVSSTSVVPLAGASIIQEESEPAVAMYTAGGRRKRLGVGGKICMLTGVKKFKGIKRTYHGKKNVRYWRPNVRWHNIWWARGRRWLRLYISMRALRMMDEKGLEYMARHAGLDLFAWSKEHWEPGSRQPLHLKVSTTSKALKDKRLWPDYNYYLNRDRPLADRFAGPKYSKKPLAWKLAKAIKAAKYPPTPPKGLKVKVGSAKVADAA
ncbi:unnamed protein product [Effrenium voratum]|nr:unnamed protein product [Effrenium voratum]